MTYSILNGKSVIDDKEVILDPNNLGFFMESNLDLLLSGGNNTIYNIIAQLNKDGSDLNSVISKTLPLEINRDPEENVNGSDPQTLEDLSRINGKVYELYSKVRLSTVSRTNDKTFDTGSCTVTKDNYCNKINDPKFFNVDNIKFILTQLKGLTSTSDDILTSIVDGCIENKSSIMCKYSILVRDGVIIYDVNLQPKLSTLDSIILEILLNSSYFKVEDKQT